MAANNPRTGRMFNEGFGVAPLVAGVREMWGSDHSPLVTGNDFTITSTAATIVGDNVAGRPAWNITNSGSTATDILQAQVPQGIIIAQPGKQLILKGGFYMSTITQEFSFGFGAIDTSIIASESTDFLKVEKLTGNTSINFLARKASGTHETWTMPITLQAAHWYDFELQCTAHATISGRGTYSFLIGPDLAGGGSMGTGGAQGISAQFPDTVALAPYFAWRAGSAANVSGYISHFGWLLER